MPGEGRRPRSRRCRKRRRTGDWDEPSNPNKCSEAADALHAKAKAAPEFRFYALYDKVYRKDVLASAYDRCKANGGAAGVDGQTFEDIERQRWKWLDELAED